METNDKNEVRDAASLPYSNPSTMLRGEKLYNTLAKVSIQDIPSAIKFLVDKLALSHHAEVKENTPHVWDNYQLSSEVKSMAPEQRKDIYGDYDDMIASIMEEEHK